MNQLEQLKSELQEKEKGCGKFTPTGWGEGDRIRCGKSNIFCPDCYAEISALKKGISACEEILNEKKTFIGTVKLCKDTDFRGIDCITDGKEIGFEGCYNDDVNHPDPRPAHRIWIKPVHAEKLYKLFSEQTLSQRNKEILEIIEKWYYEHDEVHIMDYEDLKQQLTTEGEGEK